MLRGEEREKERRRGKERKGGERDAFVSRWLSASVAALSLSLSLSLSLTLYLFLHPRWEADRHAEICAHIQL